jgi:hypothetical protein
VEWLSDSISKRKWFWILRYNEFKTGFCLIVGIEFNKLIVSLSVMLLVVAEAADWRRYYNYVSIEV